MGQQESEQGRELHLPVATESNIPTPIGDERILYQGRMIEVVEQTMQIGKEVAVFERARRSPGTRLLISSSAGNILLTREYRSEIGGYDYRLPGGKVFDSLDEYNQALQAGDDILTKSKAAAQKEAQEEVGIDTTAITHFYTSKCGATVEWDLHYFALEVPTEQLGEQNLEAGENIEVGWYTPEQVNRLALNGDISEDRSAAVIIRYLNALQQDSGLYKTQEMTKKAGSQLIQLLKECSLDSLRVRTQNLVQLQEIDSIIFVGSSFVGKSTMVDAIREAIVEEPKLASCLSIPKRIITRPKRENDNLVENTFRTLEEFSAMVASGEVGLHWIRKMEGTRTESYGFLPSETGSVPIYSANNAVVNNRESVQPGEVLGKALIIAVYAPEDVRVRRLQDRSPDLLLQKPGEVAYRLGDRAINMYQDAHIVIKDFGRYEGQAREDVVALMRLLTQNIL